MGQFFAETGESLTLYVRQLAWLRSAPRRHAKEESPPTRAERIEENGGKPLMPPLERAEYLLGYFFEAGLILSNGMGVSPLTFGEIESWRRSTARVLAPWEVKLLKKLSEAYVSEMHLAEKPECPPPYGEQVKSFDREKIGKKLGEVFRALARSN